MALQGMQDKLGISNRASDVERRLDDAVEDSFPASDPVSLSMPHDRVETRFQGLRNAASEMHVPPAATLLLAGGLLALIAFLTLRK